MNDLSWNLQARLVRTISKYRVPGASLAVLSGDTLHEAAAGILNTETGVAATTESLFHIASVTKPITATIAMQLVDEGRLTLDAPVRKYLPEFRVASREASETVTVRHLMCHASGIDGDFFIETTRGEDRLARFVEAGCDLKQLHEPGRGFSYCNFGFGVLGRIIEAIEEADFDTIWKRRISDKLEAPGLLTLPVDALRYRVAVGHMGQAASVPKAIFLGTSNGPAGATPMARARDLVSFASMHLNDGVNRQGNRVMSAGAARAMREAQNAVPEGYMATHFGLGWMKFDWGGKALYGHDGLSIFQRSYLRILPEKRAVFALLTNGGDGGGAFRALASEFFGGLGVNMPAPLSGKDFSGGSDRYTGVYERRSTVLTVEEANKGLVLTSQWTDDWAEELYGTQGPFPLRAVDENLFVWNMPGFEEGAPVLFGDPGPDGRFRSLHSGMRLNHRR